MSITQNYGSFMGRVKSESSGSDIVQLTSEANLTLPDTSNFFEILGMTAVLTIEATLMPGRMVTFISEDDTGAVFTNVNDTTDEGKMDLAADRTVNRRSTLTIRQTADGSWVQYHFQAV